MDDEQLTPFEELQRDGVYYVENPANREPEDAEVDKLINDIKKLKPAEQMRGRECNTGFEVSQNIAEAILRQYDSSKIGDKNVQSYTLSELSGESLLVARDSEDICLWAVELPKEVPDMVENQHFEEELENIREMTQTYKKVRSIGWILIILGVVGVLAIYLAILYINMR